ncbi:hypothetical protein [Nitratireductor sp. XY-223]|uniref:hypothetical protein n=1 Tax=Nitratireductor sp. XY-223 TaxID=2561926 RepID=UPI0010AA889B|nr:hypothetical protein [Nitratireductor sp. XY-223]
MAGGNGPGGLPWSGFLGICTLAASLIAGYATLKSNVAANATDISEIETSVDRLEQRSGDIRERLKAIEIIQQQQNDTLKRILRAVEG